MQEHESDYLSNIPHTIGSTTAPLSSFELHESQNLLYAQLILESDDGAMTDEA
jgi:hypothetical protein